jgi:hypothetical protein
MPFDPNNPPSKLKNLPDKKKRQWVHVFNSCYKKHKDDKTCHMQAWGAVKKSASEEDESYMALTPGIAQGCGCDVSGNCGCEHPHSMLPTASERILREIEYITRDVEAAIRCRFG